jgi:hypothetical protein
MPVDQLSQLRPNDLPCPHLLRASNVSAAMYALAVGLDGRDKHGHDEG